MDKVPDKAPEFVIKLQDKTLKQTERAIFECKVVGQPEPTITWFYEKVGKCVNETSIDRVFQQTLEEKTKKIIIESDGGLQRLVVESLTIKDAGKYTCVAENTAGKSQTEAVLTVQSEWRTVNE